MRRTAILSILLLHCISVAPVAAAPALELVPRDSVIALGGELQIDTVVSGLEAGAVAEVVSAFDLFVSYDATLLAPIGISFGSFLGGPLASFQDPFLPGELGFFSTPGVANFSELSLLPDAVLDVQQPDTFVLATLSFATLAAGTSPLAFEPHPILTVAADVKGRVAEILPLELGAALVTVTEPLVSVPEPGTMSLLATALLLVIGRRGGRTRSSLR